MINVQVSGIQKAKDELEQKLKKMFTDKVALVGIHEGAGMAADGEFTMAALGATLHFGTDRAGKNHKVSIPSRPWLDVGVKSGTPDYLEVIKNHSDDLDQAMEMIGLIAVGKVQEYMTDLQDPPNAPSTIAAKGSSNPLIDTGALRQSITYSITNVKPEEGLR